MLRCLKAHISLEWFWHRVTRWVAFAFSSLDGQAVPGFLGAKLYLFCLDEAQGVLEGFVIWGEDSVLYRGSQGRRRSAPAASPG